MTKSLARYYRGLLEEELDALQYQAAVADRAELPLCLNQLVVVFERGRTPKCTARIAVVYKRHESLAGRHAQLPLFQYTLQLPSGSFINLPATHFEPIDGERMEALKSGNKKMRQLFDLAKVSIESGLPFDLRDAPTET